MFPLYTSSLKQVERVHKKMSNIRTGRKKDFKPRKANLIGICLLNWPGDEILLGEILNMDNKVQEKEEGGLNWITLYVTGEKHKNNTLEYLKGNKECCLIVYIGLERKQLQCNTDCAQFSCITTKSSFQNDVGILLQRYVFEYLGKLTVCLHNTLDKMIEQGVSASGMTLFTYLIS